MKKYFLGALLLVVSVWAHTASAAGSFQLLNPTTLPVAGTNTNYFVTINFVYSGTATPSASIVGTALPTGLSLGSIIQQGNGVDAVTISGVPTFAGQYPITLVLTDNEGALLTEQYNLTVSYDASFSLDEINFSLPSGTAYTPYNATINFLYNNSVYSQGFTPTATFSGLPSSVVVNPVRLVGSHMSPSTGDLILTYSISLGGAVYTPGTYNPVLNLSDGQGATASFPFQFQISAEANSTQSTASPAQPVIPAPTTNVSGADAVGTNILTSDGTVSMIASNGTRRPYTSAGAFLSYGFNSWNNVVTASAADAALPVGSFIPPRDGKIICSNKGSDIGTCYLITNGQKAGFTSATVFQGLGFNFGNTTAGDVSWMTSTSSISSATNAHLPGVLINNGGTYELVTANGFIGIPNATTLQSWGYSFSDAVMANTADKQLSQTSVLTARQAGELAPE